MCTCLCYRGAELEAVEGGHPSVYTARRSGFVTVSVRAGERQTLFRHLVQGSRRILPLRAQRNPHETQLPSGRHQSGCKPQQQSIFQGPFPLRRNQL